MRKLTSPPGFSNLEGLLVLIVVVFIAVAGYYVWHRQHTAQPVQTPLTQTWPRPKNTQPCDKTCLDTAFQQVKIPSSLTLVSRIWTDKSSIEAGVTPNAWTYTYSMPISKFQQSEIDLHKAEINAGYTLQRLEAGPLIAYSQNVKAEITEWGGGNQKDGTTSVTLIVKSP